MLAKYVDILRNDGKRVLMYFEQESSVTFTTTEPNIVINFITFSDQNYYRVASSNSSLTQNNNTAGYYAAHFHGGGNFYAATITY